MQADLEARLERVEREYSQRLEHTWQYVSSLGVAIGQPPFVAPTPAAAPPPFLRAGTPVSDSFLKTYRDLAI